MKFNFSNWDSGGKTIFISSCLAFLSFFLNWVEFAFFSENGFAQGTFVLIALFIYPLVKVMQEKPLSKIAGYICAAFGIVYGIYYFFDKSGDLFGTTVYAASTGLYVFIISCVLLLFGTYKYKGN